MNDTEQANPLITEDTDAIKLAFCSKLDELIAQHDDGTYWVGSVIATVLDEAHEKLAPNVHDRGMSEIGY